ncbi:peptidase S24 and S26 domain protein [Pseudogulbenkiania sp. NH8B]|uniref:LexA family protein n=1 Tax=Pseudogulbenkiania sp. (strain NH8B) TaxID=748280 RepID=UPI0002279B50|nr:translesion error-prone DNA polymerase V autoproteolytic subunit [Pseudogulbenkiania sp. NH8B]BAK76485.1 peptidase S24 and S26 domain protein [Pseudogulbenkiania sp. NH8B]BAK76914.1 peptidase S24 and S26 domain protein [Pseudogulbenkiania sp. NH8B]
MIDTLFTPASDPPSLALPVYGSRVPAGFPSPADDYLETALDLNQYLIEDAAATFMVRVSGDSMLGAGISDGDVLVVDRSIPPAHGQIVLAAVDGEFTVKRLHKRSDRVALLPENPAYPPIELHNGQELQVWGVVTGCIKKFL